MKRSLVIAVFHTDVEGSMNRPTTEVARAFEKDEVSGPTDNIEKNVRELLEEEYGTVEQLRLHLA